MPSQGVGRQIVGVGEKDREERDRGSERQGEEDIQGESRKTRWRPEGADGCPASSRPFPGGGHHRTA